MIELAFFAAGSACGFAIAGFFSRIALAGIRETVYKDATKAAFSRLANDAYWFSEDPPTMYLLTALSRNQPVSSARDEWREARKNPRQDATGPTGIMGGKGPTGPSAHMCPACGRLFWGSDHTHYHAMLPSHASSSSERACSGSGHRMEPLPTSTAASPQGAMSDEEAFTRRRSAKRAAEASCRTEVSELTRPTHVITRFGDFMTLERLKKNDISDLGILGSVLAFPELGPMTLRDMCEIIGTGVTMTDEEVASTGIFCYC